MAIALRADYENANGRLLAVEDGPTIRFEAEARTSPRPLWFRFALDGLPGERPVTLVLANAAGCLGGLRSFEHVRPVWREPGGEWRRVGPGRIDEDAGSFAFDLPPAREAEVAFSHPFSVGDLRAWIDGLPAEVRRETLTVSPEGHDVPLLAIGERESAEQGVWLAARHHAGEAPGSFALQGLVDWLCATEEGRALTARVAFAAVPMVDIDGVARGDYGKSAAPVDHWEDWGETSRRPVIRALRECITAWTQSGAYDLWQDFHAPTPAGPNYAYVGDEAPHPAEMIARQQRLLGLIEAEAPGDCPMRAVDAKVLAEERRGVPTARLWQAREFGALAVTLELSYHRTAAGTWTEPESLRRFGAAVGRAIARYFDAR